MYLYIYVFNMHIYIYLHLFIYVLMYLFLIILENGKSYCYSEMTNKPGSSTPLAALSQYTRPWPANPSGPVENPNAKGHRQKKKIANLYSYC